MDDNFINLIREKYSLFATFEFFENGKQESTRRAVYWISFADCRIWR